MIKKLIRDNKITHQLYESGRAFYHRTRKLIFFISDAKRTFRDMRWGMQTNSSYWATSAEMLFQYHKLEKGLCMPGKRRFFGYDPAKATLELLNSWREQNYSLDDPVYKGAIETIYAYRQRIDETPTEHCEQLKKLLDAEISLNVKRSPELQTPVPAKLSARKDAAKVLETLALDRRSVRSFAATEIDVELIRHAVTVAQLSPSACNRQPCRVHVYKDRARINDMLELQNGNRGFGHTMPLLLVLSAEASCFFDASERHEPYVDGGLFAMSLILSLQSLGLSSCCLNWCVEPWQDKLAHERGSIAATERIIMYIAVGYPEDAALVPRSPRRSIDTLISVH